jgi:hypothetical protein
MKKQSGWKQISLLAVMVSLLALTGCGGGGGGGDVPVPVPVPTPTPTPTPTPAASVKGFWGGTQGTVATSAIILANGDSWFVFQESGVATRFARLQTTPNSTSFSSSGVQYLLQNGTTEAASATGTFVEKASLTGALTAASGSSTLGLLYNSQYDIPASLNDAVGSWKGGYGNSGSTLTMTVTSAGVLSGTSSTGCSYSGTLQPRSADPAVFDLGFTKICLVGAAKTLGGVATVNAAKTSLFFAVTTADKTQGALFTGARQ